MDKSFFIVIAVFFFFESKNARQNYNTVKNFPSICNNSYHLKENKCFWKRQYIYLSFISQFFLCFIYELKQ